MCILDGICSTSVMSRNSCSLTVMNIFRVTGPLCGEFTRQRPMTRSFDVFFHLRLKKRLSK